MFGARTPARTHSLWLFPALSFCWSLGYSGALVRGRRIFRFDWRTWEWWLKG
jgi:hypothetical protein